MAFDLQLMVAGLIPCHCAVE